ncbi:MAG TPA: SusD/RagB family nutrient-binding outer membrane lipoprotein [Flavisolibacter sp.]|nr:SusD/RagB family nutrient-binding outer membrane lipoprotein [Flavisolibacter sp.]
MKKSILYITGVLVFGAVLPSCKKYLDINKSPNAAETLDPKLLFSNATTQYINLRSGGDLYIPMALGGQSIADGGNNPDAWGAPSAGEYTFSVFNYANSWNTFYLSAGTNLKQAIALAESANPKNNNAAAQCKVLLAQDVYDLTTTFGDVPFSEAWRADISYPKFDPQKNVFEGAIALLDEALAQFDESSTLKISDYDLFYKGDIAKWKKVAKSLKLRILMTMVDKDPSKATAIGQLVSGGGLVSSPANNFLVSYQNVAGRKNPKYALGEQYNGGNNFFFASKYVADFMRPLNDPRLPLFFTKPAAADNYYGIEPGTDGDDTHDARISTSLQSAASPEVVFSYQEELFYEAEIQARGLGVPVNLANANTLYKKAVEESCKFYGVPAATAAAFAAGLPDLATVANPVKLIHYHHWVDKMDRGLDAFTEWRRSGPEGDEVPALTLPVGAPAGPLFRRYEYPSGNELSINPNAPVQIRYNVKMWFDL